MQLLNRIFAVDAAAAEATAVNGGDVVTAFVIIAVGDLRNLTSAVGATDVDGGGGGGGAGGDEAERKIKRNRPMNITVRHFCFVL